MLWNSGNLSVSQHDPPGERVLSLSASPPKEYLDRTKFSVQLKLLKSKLYNVQPWRAPEGILTLKKNYIEQIMTTPRDHTYRVRYCKDGILPTAVSFPLGPGSEMCPTSASLCTLPPSRPLSPALWAAGSPGLRPGSTSWQHQHLSQVELHATANCKRHAPISAGSNRQVFTFD